MRWFRELGRDRPWAQGCVIAAAGIVLGASGCFGFILSSSYASNTSTLFKVLGSALSTAFFVGCAAFVVGGVWFLVGIIRAIAAERARKRADGQPPEAP